MVVLLLRCTEKLRGKKARFSHTSKWLKISDNSPRLKSVMLKDSNPSTQRDTQLAGLGRKQECTVVGRRKINNASPSCY